MPITIASLASLTPAAVLHQDRARDVFAAQPGLTRLARRLITTSFDQSGVATRHCAIGDLGSEAQASSGDAGLFYDRSSGLLLSPGTQARNEVYTRRAGELFVEAARRACARIDAGTVTHVITVSCTGFFSPGPDFVIARELGLAPGVQRFHLGFMGCYAALPALRLAWQLCRADPDAVVLVVCVELCTLHMRSSNDPDQIIGASLFADGAAAAVVHTGGGLAGLDGFATRTTPTGEDAMTWTIGDEGFTMVLSSYVPHIIGDHILHAIEPLLSGERPDRAGPGGITPSGITPSDITPSDITHWVVHPGGRSIVDRVAARLGLEPAQVAASRSVLREFGNMSSATVLFVLERALAAARPGERLCALAFGPGLTVESALLTAL